jgi:hypothetical protein
MLLPPSALKKETAGFSDTLLTVCQNPQCYISEYNQVTRQINCSGSLQVHNIKLDTFYTNQDVEHLVWEASPSIRRCSVT